MIELLISTAMIVVMMGVALRVGRHSDTFRDVTVEANQFISMVREAQTASLSAEGEYDELTGEDKHICGYGIHIEEAEYTFFFSYANDAEYVNDPDVCQNTSYYSLSAPHVEEIRVYPLTEKGMKLAGDRLEKTLFFRAPYGDAYFVRQISDDFEVEFIDLGNEAIRRTVRANSRGKVELSGESSQ